MIEQKIKTFTIEDIRSWDHPCYDPIEHLPKDWSGTVIDILKHEAIPAQDKIWVVCRENLISARTLRMFAVFCAREALSLIKDPDPRSIAACDTAERFANGLAGQGELDAARAAAYAAQIAKLIEMCEAEQ